MGGTPSPPSCPSPGGTPPAATTAQSLLLSVGEVAALLGGGIGERSVWRWLEAGRFPKPVRLGGRTLWRRRDVERFVLEADGDLAKFNRIKRGER